MESYMDEGWSGEADGWVEDASMRRARILLVDDNADALCLLELFLQGRGFAVMMAGDVDAACVKVAEALPDLIITDYLMPGQICRCWTAPFADCS